ncbi:hypothetical protein NDU88_002898 [Pleurodeles waltl]|uniref:Uncharacterized protein n=1 Tax=Pleurodeles waltl TaxID=8319 RepID=A0AAV7P825_PLEWA|nr:hypothetical protein NDU88_002898 [Pleurodeles waltl]
MPSGPSEEATGADTAASNPERDQALSNPFELPGRRRQKRPVRGSREGVVKEEEPADGGDNADETGEMETEEERLLLKQAVIEDSLGRQEPAARACEETPDSTVAREAFFVILPATLLEKRGQARCVSSKDRGRIRVVEGESRERQKGKSVRGEENQTATE